MTPTTLIVRTNEHAGTLTPVIRRAIGETAPGVAAVGTATGETFIGTALAQPRMNALLLYILLGRGTAARGGRPVRRHGDKRSAADARPAGGAHGAGCHARRHSGAWCSRTRSCWRASGSCLASSRRCATTRALGRCFDVSPRDGVTLAMAGAVLLGVALGAASPARRAQQVNPTCRSGRIDAP